MSIDQRLKEFMKTEDLSVQQLANTLNQSEKSLYNYLSGRTTPKIDLAEALLIAYPTLNARWLLTGRGDMLLSDSEKEKIESEILPPEVLWERVKQYEAKIVDLERIIDGNRRVIESNERTIGNQQELIEMLRGK